MTTNLSVPVILGTAREGRRSAAVADAIISELKERDFLTQLIDVAEFTMAGTNSPERSGSLDRFGETVAAADGFVIVTPEYNHGYPGELKMLLDSEFDAYHRKPVGLVGVSAGTLGGTRVVEQLKLVTHALGMVNIAPSLYITDVRSFQPASLRRGRLGEATEAMFAEIERYAGLITP